MEMESRFCGMRLRTAGVVIGWLWIVGCVFNLFEIFNSFEKAEKWSKDISNFFDEPEEYYADTNKFVIFVHWLSVGINVLELMAGALLLRGIIKKRHSLMVPWLISMVICITFSFIILLICFYMMFVQTPYFVLAAMFLSLSLGISLYLYKVVRALYDEIKLENTRGRAPLVAVPVQVSGMQQLYPLCPTDYAKV